MTTTTDTKIENIIEDKMMEYASYVLLDRALPDLRDGLKPVHRRILYSMLEQNATKFTKSANMAGAVMRLHPHGSSYGTMVSMVQTDKQLHPMLEGKGNFGQHTARDLAPAADRYSEVRLSKISLDMMKDFNKNIVNFIPNYDGSMMMPEVLPVKFPAILAYSQSGIGVGFSSSTMSFNLKELSKAIIKYLETNEKTILAPDFPTGGTIIKDEETFKQINEQGKGTVRIRGKAEITGNEILITEIPYSTTREAIIERIEKLAKEGKLREVSDVKDLTGLKGMLIEVTARRGTDMEMLLEKLFRFTPLQSTYSANMNILVDDLPKVLGVWPIIDKWLDFRRSSIERSIIYDVKQLSKKLHLLKGLEKVLLDIDEAIEIIRTSSAEKIEINLQNKFEIDYDQAVEVANMKLRNINSEYILKKIKDVDNLEKEIERLKFVIGKEEELNKIVIEGLEETYKQYGQGRKSLVESIREAPVITVEDHTPNYNVNIFLTKEGYMYKFKGQQEPHLKPGDEVFKKFETNNLAEVLVFDSLRNCYKIPVRDIEDTRANTLGTFIPGMMNFDEDIVNYSILDENVSFLIMAYSNNRVSKVDIKSFNGNRKILKNSYNAKQDLVDILTMYKDETIKMKTDRTEVKFETSDLNMTGGRGATGVYITRKGNCSKVQVV